MPQRADTTPAVQAACQAVADGLRADGLTRLSIYLARGHRLRLQAQHGYRHVFDGLPPTEGIVGRAFREGRTVVADTAAVAVPIRCGAAVAGALALETGHLVPAAVVARLEEAAAEVGEALERLGHSLSESPAQRLVRHAVRLRTLGETTDIRLEALAAACDVAELESAALVAEDAAGTFVVVEALGALAAELRAVEPATLARIADLVASGSSCYTVAAEGEDAGGLGELRAAGAEAVIALPITAGPAGRGALLVADRRLAAPSTEVVELLELLAAHTASCLRTAGALEELRARAATDALTGLGHHATFHQALAAARDRREAIAVLLADVDGFKAINDTRGHQAGDRVLRETAAALSSALRRGDELFRVGGDEFAALVRVADGHEAVEVGRRLCEAVASLGDLTVSIGAALPEPAESDESVLARADRALYDVKGLGRDGVSLAPL